MKKVVHLINSLSTGGAETLVKDYAILLDKTKIDVAVLASYDVGQTANRVQLQEQEIKVVFLNRWIKNPIIRRTMGLFQRNAQFREYLKHNQVDVIHGHLDANKYLLLNLKKIKGMKLFYTVHNEPYVVFEKNFLKRINKHMTRFLIKHRQMRLIALHDDMRIQLNNMFGVDNTIVVNNGIDLLRFDQSFYADQATQIRQSVGLTADDFVVGHVGRFNVQKNHQFLITVFTAFVKEKPNAKLLLIGSGELKPAVLQQIADNHIEDRVVLLENRRDIPELMSIMDVFLFPSNWEGLGIVLVEAQAMGLKCIASSEVPKAVHLTNHLFYVDLAEDAQKWCEVILDDTISSTPTASLADYNMKDIVKKLENIYLS